MWIIRGLVVICLVILFFPGIKFNLPWIKPRLAVLLDVSASMSNQVKQSQLENIRRRLTGETSGIRLETYLFSDSLRSSSNLEAAEFDGVGTNLLQAIQRFSVTDADAVLLISDGRHNGPSLPDRSLTETPLWSMAVGEKGLPDLGIEKVSLADSGTVIVRIRSLGIPGQSTTLRLFADSDLISSNQVKVAETGLTEVTLSPPESLYPSAWRVELDSLPGEDRTGNNSLTLRGQRKRKKLKILFVAGQISAETEGIMRSLRGIPDIDLNTHIEISQLRSMGIRDNNFDIVVVGPMGVRSSPEIIKLITSAARDGLPLLFISAVDELPAELESLSPLKKQEITESGGGNLRINHPGDLFLAKWMPDITQPYPLTWAPSANSRIIYGEGNAAFIARRGRNIGIELPFMADLIANHRSDFRTFLQTILQFLDDPAGFPFSFSLQKATESAVEITIFSGIDASQDPVRAWLEPDSTPLDVVPVSDRVFSASGTSEQGEKELRISWKGSVYEPRGNIVVQPVPPETPSRGANHELLSWLAEMNSGRLIEPDEIDILVESLPAGKEIVYRPLGNPWLVIFITLLFLGEIWYRRKNGLP